MHPGLGTKNIKKTRESRKTTYRIQQEEIN